MSAHSGNKLYIEKHDITLHIGDIIEVWHNDRGRFSAEVVEFTKYSDLIRMYIFETNRLTGIATNLCRTIRHKCVINKCGEV